MTMLEKSENKLPWPNECVYIENSSKTAFFISKLIVGETEFTPSNVRYINANALFCLKFFYANPIDSVTLQLNSLDERLYKYDIRFLNNRAISITRKCDDSKQN